MLLWVRAAQLLLRQCEMLNAECVVVFVCTAALAILDRLDEIDQETLGWWLAERQLPNGGLNGRPEKLEDVCYSFWVLSAMAILKNIPWIDADKLTAFILSAQVRLPLHIQSGFERLTLHRTLNMAASRIGPETRSMSFTPTLASRVSAPTGQIVAGAHTTIRSVAVGLPRASRSRPRVLHACADYRAQRSEEELGSIAAKDVVKEMDGKWKSDISPACTLL